MTISTVLQAPTIQNISKSISLAIENSVVLQ